MINNTFSRSILVFMSLLLVTQPVFANTTVLPIPELKARVQQHIVDSIDPQSGAIAIRPIGEAKFIHPWFAYSAAKALLAINPNGQQHVRNWLSWLCKNVNQSPKGYTGTFFIHDIDASGKLIKRTGETSHTATDNWSAAFLILADDYHKKSGDTAFIKSCLVPLRSAGNHLGTLLVGDKGSRLTTGAPDIATVYTTDNLYSHEGLLSLSRLLNRVGEDGTKYSGWAAEIKKGISSDLFVRGRYLTALRQSNFSWQVFYGDAVANIEGLLVNDPTFKARSRSLWNQFLKYQRPWIMQVTSEREGSKIVYYDRSEAGPWTKVSYAAILANDPATALAFTYNLAIAYNNFERPLPGAVNINELGWLLLTLSALGNSAVIDNDHDAITSKGTKSVSAVANRLSGSLGSNKYSSAQKTPLVGPTYLVGEGQTSSVTANLPVAKAGLYDVYLLDVPNPSRSSSVLATLSCPKSSSRSSAVVTRLNINQTTVPTRTGRLLGSCYLAVGNPSTVRVSTSKGSFSFDGILLVAKSK